MAFIIYYNIIIIKLMIIIYYILIIYLNFDIIYIYICLKANDKISNNLSCGILLYALLKSIKVIGYF